METIKLSVRCNVASKITQNVMFFVEIHFLGDAINYDMLYFILKAQYVGIFVQTFSRRYEQIVN